MELNDIETPNDVYQFMCDNIEYGWIDINGNKHLHCFVLYYENGKVYHIEHPNFDNKGIFKYDSEKEAIDTIVNYYIKLRGGKDSPTKEFYEVPIGTSFKEFNKYINHV